MKIVLVHGSWHDGETFGPVAAHLRHAGHEVYTPTIVGHGKDVPKNLNHADCVASIVEFIKSNSITDCVLLELSLIHI